MAELALRSDTSVDNVARAIFDAEFRQNHRRGVVEWGLQDKEVKAHYRDIAKAAIEAMIQQYVDDTNWV